MSEPVISAQECQALVAAVADLSLSVGLTWRVHERVTTPGLPALAADLAKCRAEGRVFYVPPDARDWFGLRFAQPDAGYALAVMYLWVISAVQESAADRDADLGPTTTGVLTWYLSKALPADARKAVPRVQRGLPRTLGPSV